MAIILTNGEFYIRTSKEGGIQKTDNIEEAQTFYSCNRAMRKVLNAPGKCKGYYPYDTNDTEWNRSREKQIRKKYLKMDRRMIYDKAGGHCQLCGRKIPLENMSLDHIYPLSMGGADSLENLQCTCEVCNRFKSNILPDTFFDRITEIFIYQMEKKYGDNAAWKMSRNLLMEIL